MASFPNPSTSPRQLSLDLDDMPPADIRDAGVKRSVVFPKNIQIYNVPDFQRQVSKLIEPLNINIEFRVTRQNRLEMRWSFPQEAVHYDHRDVCQKTALSPEENAAFETLVLSFAGTSH